MAVTQNLLQAPELPLFVANEEGKVLKIDWKEL